LLQHQEFIEANSNIEEPEQIKKFPILHQLPTHFYQELPKFSHNHQNPSSLKISHNNTPRITGIVTHDLLQWICTYHPESISDVPWEMSQQQLKTFGLTTTELQIAKDLVKKQISTLFDDPIGQWIIRSHDDERNEYEFLVEHQGEVVTRIMDRTFCEHGTRWIIDFKTGRNDANTQAKYREQLNEYARIFSTRSIQSIRCGIYYLENSTWVDWVSVE